jgi:hypothetical protein
MYCKHCGKEIADDSKFCQHCGEKLDTTSSTPKVVSEQKSNESVVATKNYESSAIKFFAKNKVYIVLNIIWVIINILLLLQGEENIYEYSHGGHRFKANEVFYPFTSTGYQTSYSFNAKYYDWTEFLVYCLLIPLIVYILIMIWKSPVGESVKTWIRKFEATEQDNSGLTNSNLTSTHDKIEDEENRKEEVSASITNETSTQTKYDSGVYDDNNDEVTLDGFLEFIVDAIKIMGVILFSFLALTLSLMYIRNFILGCLLSIGSGILTFYLIRKKNHQKDETSNESKDERSPLYYTGLIVFTILLLFAFYKMGESLILKSINNQTQPTTIEKPISLDEQLKLAVKNTKSKLPMLIDESLSWTNIKIVKNGVECVYLIDDANIDLYQIDLGKYKEEIANNLKSIADKRFLELCVQTKKQVNFKLVSQWDKSKSVNITFGSLEIDELLNTPSE